MPGSIKYISLDFFEQLLQELAVYKYKGWGDISIVLSDFVNQILTIGSYSVIHRTKTGSTTYCHSLAKLTPDLVWEMALRAMCLYSKKDIFPLTKGASEAIKHFLDIPTYEDADTCTRIVHMIISNTKKLAKKVGLPKLTTKFTSGDSNESAASGGGGSSASGSGAKSVSDPIEKMYKSVCDLIIVTFPKVAVVINAVLHPEYILSPSTLPASLSEIRSLTREVHPDKLVSDEIPEKTKKIAGLCIIILNQLKEEGTTKISITIKHFADLM